MITSSPATKAENNIIISRVIMMSKADLRKLSVAQLKDMVRKHNIKGFSTMRKEELVSAIHKHQRSAQSAAFRKTLTSDEKFRQSADQRERKYRLNRAIESRTQKATKPKAAPKAAAPRRSTRARRAPRRD